MLLFLCASCHRTTDGKDSTLGRSGEAHTAKAVEDELADSIYAYQRAVIAAENAVMQFVKDEGQPWVQHEYGWWYRILRTADEATEADMPDDDNYNRPTLIHETIRDLTGRLLRDAERKYHEDDEPFCYQIMSREINQTDTILMVSPWYVAFGKDTTTFIPPRTNVQVRLYRLR